MFSLGFWVIIKREIKRFLFLYKQTLLPSAISSALYIIVFGAAMGPRIGSIKGASYIHYIIPGLVMKDNRPLMPFGVMGAHYQPVGQTHFFTVCALRIAILLQNFDFHSRRQRKHVFATNSNNTI